MTKLNFEQIEHIGKLSRLELSDSEKELYAEQLSKVLTHVEELNAVKTDDVVPTSNVTGLTNISRDDQVLESGISHKDIKLNAPEFDGGSFVVPGVFE